MTQPDSPFDSHPYRLVRCSTADEFITTSRRRLLAAGAAAMAVPMIVPRTVLRILRYCITTAILIGACARGFAADATPAVKWHPGHYMLVGPGEIKAEHILEHFRGVQKRYTWASMEPAEGRYDFSRIRNDLALLKKHGKQLVVQIQYKAFGKDQRCVPDYVQGPEYGGGVYRASSGSFDPVLWNAKVGQRMDAVFTALGREFDEEPGVEAMVLPETSPSAALEKFPQPGVEPYTTAIYVAALKQRMAALRRALPHTVVIQYANFPQQALPELTAYMKEIGVGLGGPDVYPGPSGLSDPEKGIYRLYAPLSGTVALGAAVQSPDYSVALWKRTAAFNRGQDRNSVVVTPEEEKPIPVREHLKLAREKLKLNYLFWSANPKACFENVKMMLAEPDLAGDPAGGLDGRCPSRAFILDADAVGTSSKRGARRRSTILRKPARRHKAMASLASAAAPS